MFCSYNQLKRKTPEQGVDRQEFIKHLVEEYYISTDVEAQEQVTANLANFAYDPINWNYLKTANVLKLLFELLESPNEKLQLHGSAGLSNICLDQQAYNVIVRPQNIDKINNLLLRTKTFDTILNSLALLYQLLQHKKSNKHHILSATILKQIKYFKTVYESDQRIVNICSLLLDEFGTRYELVEGNAKM